MPIHKLALNSFVIVLLTTLFGCSEQAQQNKNQTTDKAGATKYITPNSNNSTVGGYILRNSAGDIITRTDIKPLTAHTTLEPSHVRGARIYDDFFIELDEAAPAGDNPLLSVGTLTGKTGALSGADSYKCAHCHGYDYEGGVYEFHNGATNNLLELHEVRGRTEEDIFHLLMNGFNIFDGTTVVNVHNYSTLLNEQAIVDVSDFVVNEIYDTHAYVRAPTNEGLGDHTEGGEIYNSTAAPGEIPAIIRVNGANFNCVDCHGASGNDVAGISLYQMAWSMPFKWLHRVNFGSPRSLAAHPDITAEDATVHPGLYEVVLTHGLHFGGPEQAAALLAYSQEVTHLAQ